MALSSFRGLIPGAFPESFAEEQPLPVQTSTPFATSGSALYHPPQYRYPHTLSFLGRFSPEDEASMIRQFQQMDGQQDRAVPPPVSSFRSSFHISIGPPSHNDDTGGWAEFTADLLTMGLGWAAQNLGLQIQHVSNHQVDYQDKATQIEQVTSTSPVIRPECMPKTQTPMTASVPSSQEPPTTPKYVQGLGKLQNGQYTPATTVSDTEEDSDLESFARKYIGYGSNVIENPVTVFGPGAIVNRSMGGRLHAQHDKSPRRSRRNRVAKRPTVPKKDHSKSLLEKQLEKHVSKSAASEEADKIDDEQLPTDVKYPTLPTLSDRETEPTVPYTKREIGRRPPDPHDFPGLPPVQPSTPAGYDPSYRYRRPDDTRFHHGSAGVNPLGAHARRVAKEQAGAPSTAGNTRSVSAVRRHHRIVSGSFGIFEVNKPNRFDERKYRLLQRGKKKDKMIED